MTSHIDGTTEGEGDPPGVAEAKLEALRARNAELRRGNAEMEARIAAHPTMEELTREHDRLRAETAGLEARAEAERRRAEPSG